MNASSISSNLAYAGTIPLEESKIESRGPLDAQGSCYLNFTAGSNSCAWAGIADKPWPETAQVVVSGWNEKNKIRAGQGGTALSEAQLDRFAFTSVRGEDRNAKLIKGGWMVPVMNKPLSPPFGIICQPEQQNVALGGHIILAANTLKPEAVTYQWLKDVKVIPGATDSVYHTRVITGSEGGFSCCTWLQNPTWTARSQGRETLSRRMLWAPFIYWKRAGRSGADKPAIGASIMFRPTKFMAAWAQPDSSLRRRHTPPTPPIRRAKPPAIFW